MTGAHGGDIFPPRYQMPGALRAEAGVFQAGVLFEMTAQMQTLSEVTQRATDALIKEIGVIDTMRFLSQFRSGTGNYTEERAQLRQGMSVKEIVADIKARRNTDQGRCS